MLQWTIKGIWVGCPIKTWFVILSFLVDLFANVHSSWKEKKKYVYTKPEIGFWMGVGDSQFKSVHLHFSHKMCLYS